MKTVQLPLQEAVNAAAEQNYERDRKVLKEFDKPFNEADVELKQIYLEEAKHLLVTTGENYIPDFEDESHIVLLK